MNATAFASRATTGLVALVAGYASYTHIVKVASAAGEHMSVAAVLPLAIDGAILVGTLAMMEDKRAGRKPRLSARIAVAFGVIATLASNVASAQPTATARLVAIVPPLAFLIAVEVLSRRGKLLAPEPVAEPVAVVEPVAVEPATPEPVAVEREPVKSAPTREPRREPARRAPRSLTSADRVMAAHLAEPDATHARIAELAGCSLATVKRYRPKIASGSTDAAEAAATVVNGNVPDLAGVAQ